MPVEAVHHIEATATARSLELELGVLGAQYLDERVAAEPARVVDGHARGLGNDDEVFVGVEHGYVGVGHVGLNARDDVHELVAVAQRVIRVGGLAIDGEGSASCGLSDVLWLKSHLAHEYVLQRSVAPSLFCVCSVHVCVRCHSSCGTVSNVPRLHGERGERAPREAPREVRDAQARAEKLYG